MKFLCPKCSSKYVINDSRIGSKALNVRCKKCGTVIKVQKPQKPKTAITSKTKAKSSRSGPTIQELRDRLRSSKATKEKKQSSSTPSKKPKTESLPSWYYSIDGQTFGPFPEPELLSRFQKDLTQNTYVWKKDFTEWKLVVDVPPFSELFKESKPLSFPTQHLNAEDVETVKAEQTAPKKQPISQPQDTRKSLDNLLDKLSPKPSTKAHSKSQTQSLQNLLNKLDNRPNVATKPPETTEEHPKSDPIQSSLQRDQTNDLVSNLTQDQPRPKADNQESTTGGLEGLLSKLQAPEKPFKTETQQAVPQEKPQEKPQMDLVERLAQELNQEVTLPKEESQAPIPSPNSQPELDLVGRLAFELNQEPLSLDPLESNDSKVETLSQESSAKIGASSVEPEKSPEISAEVAKTGTSPLKNKVAESEIPWDIEKKTQKNDLFSSLQLPDTKSWKPLSTADSNEDIIVDLHDPTDSEEESHDIFEAFSPENESQDIFDNFPSSIDFSSDVHPAALKNAPMEKSLLIQLQTIKKGSRKIKIIAFGAIILIVIGLGSIIYSLSHKKDTPPPPPKEETSTTINTTTHNREPKYIIATQREVIRALQTAENTAVFESIQGEYPIEKAPDGDEYATLTDPKKNTHQASPKKTEKQRKPKKTGRFGDLDHGTKKLRVEHKDTLLEKKKKDKSRPDPAIFSDGLKHVRRSVQRCWERQLKKSDEVNLLNVHLEILVDTSGRVNNVSIDKVAKGTTFERCLQSQKTQWTFPKFSGGPVLLKRKVILQADM